MARKPKHEEHENHERWLVSYADFITLLFAFFVVMYAISSVNEGKYRVLSSALVSAFSHPQKTIEPIQYGSPLRSPIIQHESIFEKEKFQDQNTMDRAGVNQQMMPTPEEIANMEKISDEIEHNLRPLIDQQLINLNKTNQGLEIEINSKILFASGAAVLSPQALSPLKKIAAVLSKTPNDINVEGYTDTVPISTEFFPSNWELSSARAASVVRLFTQSGLEPQRLKAIGFAEFQPVADNITEFGRSKNRRVTIMVLNKPEEKRVAVALNQRNKKTPSEEGEVQSQGKSAPIPLTLPTPSGNSGEAPKNGAPKMLPVQLLKPSVTALPLSSAKPDARVADSPTTAQPQSAPTPLAPVKSSAPISLPVLQAQPQAEGARK